MSELSVVIITYNNYSLKNGCIESVLLALDSQSDVHFDVAVVDNHSSSEDYEMLKDFVSDICFRFDLCLLRNSCNNISKGRNMGVHHTQGDTILFLDDDMLLLEKDILYQVLQLSKEKEYGCAAIREWTPKGWYDNNKHVLESYLRNKERSINVPLQDPIPNVRRKGNLRHLVRTYIGNFGFIKRSALEKIGFWNEHFIGYGLEDDCIAFLLYLNFGEPVRFDSIHVIHVWHEIAEQNYMQLENNKQIFRKILLKQGVAKFHSGHMLYGDGDVIEKM